LFFLLAACAGNPAAPSGNSAVAPAAAEADAGIVAAPEIPALPPEARGNLAILPFTGGAGEEGETIAELFSFERALTGGFNPVPRTSITQAIQGEQRFQMTGGMTDPDTIAALDSRIDGRAGGGE
jgi:hypothetical protein